MNAIKDVKPLIDLPVIGWWIVLAVVLSLAAALSYFFWKKNKQVPVHAPAVPERPAWEIALERLKALELKQYPSKGQFKLYYIELADIVRHYLEGRFNIKAPEMTTEEFLLQLRLSAALKEHQKGVLKDFLIGCDMVKFAKYEPSSQDAAANFKLAKQLIEETQDGI